MQQPKTHLLLRNSRFRKNQSNKNSHVDSSNLHNHQVTLGPSKDIDNFNNNEKYHFNYFKPNNNKPKIIINESSPFHKQKYQIEKEINKYSKENLVVCNSLPHGTRPRYSFSFKQAQKHNSSQILSSTIFIQPEQKQYLRNSNFVLTNRGSHKLKKDLDLCLYNLADKLKEIKNKENQIQKPSINQLRASKFEIDKNIYRIEPKLLEKYVEAIYKEYQIPNPLLKQSLNCSQIKKQSDPSSNQLSQRISFNAPKIDESKKYQQNQIVQSLNKPISKIQNHYVGRHNNHFVQKDKNRIKKRNKKTFLNITLSKQKNMQSKIIYSPIKITNKPQVKESPFSDSKSLSKKSHSQKKIQQLKKNISNWRDNQNLYVERYSYIQSPYQIISHRNQGQSIKNQTQSIKNQAQSIKNQTQKIIVKVRPFDDLMKISVPSNDSIYLNQNTTLSSINKNPNISHLMESKYHSTFITQDGQIVEEFRFCLLCQQPILSANIEKHEEKCIGWIYNEKIYNFKDLYGIKSEKQLKNLIHQKILEIKNRMFDKIKLIQEKEQRSKQSYSEEINKNILTSIKDYLNSFTCGNNERFIKNTDQLNSNFKNVQKNFNNLYWQLMEDASKLHWFLKLLQNYSRFLQIVSISSKKQESKFHQYSTFQQHNTQSFTQAYNTVSEFPIDLFKPSSTK